MRRAACDPKLVARFLTPVSLASLIAIGAWGVIQLLWGERIVEGEGLGWDGIIYARLAKDFWHLVFAQRTVDAEHLSKILPSALAHYALRGVGAPLSNANIILVFRLFDFAAILGAALLWVAIADGMGLSERGQLLGFFALFVNFCNLKFALYYPVLTDSFGLFFATAMLCGHVRRAPAAVFVAWVAGALCWMPLLYGGIALLWFRDRPLRFPARFAAWTAVPALIAAALVVAGTARSYLTGCRPYLSATPTWRELAWLSIGGVGLYFFFGVRGLLAGCFAPDSEAPSPWKRRLLELANPGWYGLAVLISLVAWKLFVARFQRPAIFADFLFCGPAALLTRSIVMPLVFLVSSGVYYGPMVFLVVWRWRPLCRVAGESGLGALLFIALGFCVSITSEARHLIHLLPFVAAFVAAELDRRGLTWKQVALLGGAQAVCSKAWYPINVAPMAGHYSDFPWQRYFMNQGPWMSRTMYLIQGAVLVAAAALLYLGFRRVRESSAADAPYST